MTSTHSASMQRPSLQAVPARHGPVSQEAGRHSPRRQTPSSHASQPVHVFATQRCAGLWQSVLFMQPGVTGGIDVQESRVTAIAAGTRMF